MNFATGFTYWIMLNYSVAAIAWAVQGDYARSVYWLFAIGIMATAMFMVK